MVEQTKSSISVVDGRFFDLLKPADFVYDIEAIAHSLSRINRYTGHIETEYYSVAEHSVLVSYAAPTKYAFEGLMHDASEAFVGDVSSPLKKLLGVVYTDIEDAIQEAIANQFGYQYPYPDEIHEADKRVYWAERKYITPNAPRDALWHQELRASRKVLPIGLSPNKAKQYFLDRFNELTNGQYRKAA